ncbi:MAG TPA: tetratricopeptide repeat protein [Bryobacteraceae bacterium]|nr:tetratricopeptide repeat protein [Bryobacteraceae bacterium]
MRVFLLLTGVFCATMIAQEADSDRLLAAAAHMKTDERIAAYQKLAASKPDDLHYQNLLAGAYIQKMRETTDFGYIERAEKLVAHTLTAEAANYEALRLRSEIGLERHHFAEVAGFSREMIRIAPDDAWNWGTLGDALMELGQYDDAADAYQKMMSLRPNQSSYNRASYYRWVMGDAEGAIAIMRQAIEAGSPAPENTAWCLVDLGNLYFKTGRLEQAAGTFSEALRTFPGYHPAHAGLGRVQAAQGKLAEAIENFKRAQAVVPMPEYAAALAELYERTGKKANARQQLELLDVVDRVVKANNEKTNRNLALVYADQGRKLDRALELAQAELDVRGDVYTYDALAWALFKNGRYAEAEQAAGKALRFGTPDPAFYFHAGMIASALRKQQEAAKSLDRALALNPHFDPRQAEIAETTLRTARNP